MFPLAMVPVSMDRALAHVRRLREQRMHVRWSSSTTARLRSRCLGMVAITVTSASERLPSRLRRPVCPCGCVGRCRRLLRGCWRYRAVEPDIARWDVRQHLHQHAGDLRWAGWRSHTWMPIGDLNDLATLRFEWTKIPRQQVGFRGVLPRRWVVERTFAWLGQNHRLSKDYERLCATSEALIYASMSRLMMRRLTRARHY